MPMVTSNISLLGRNNRFYRVVSLAGTEFVVGVDEKKRSWLNAKSDVDREEIGYR
jgi:hypothetical protein